MNIKAYMFMENGGDGSAGCLFFETAELRDKYADLMEEHYEIFADCDRVDQEFEVVEGVLKPIRGWQDYYMHPETTEDMPL